MSRYSFKRPNDPNTYVYGFDHATGYFYQVYDKNDELIVDVDSMFHGLTGPRLALLICNNDASRKTLISASLADVPKGVNAHHITNMMLDLPF